MSPWVDTAASRPSPSSPAAAARMHAARRRDTAPELAVRRALFARGLRYFVDYRLPIPRARADIAFPKKRLAVFIDGCFWHGCPEHATWPKANAEWWRAKITANMERDRRIDRLLGEAGWRVVRAWAHEPTEDVVARVVSTAAPTSDGSPADRDSELPRVSPRRRSRAR